MNFFQIKDIKEATDLKGKKVILRLDSNVPMENARITDDFRILKLLPVLEYLQEKGAISLVISHLDAEGESLAAVGNYLNKKFPVTFIRNILGEEAKEAIAVAKESDVILFENIRQYPEEEENDQEFAERIAGLGDLYVNDAFPASHRAHASIVGIPKFMPHYAGIQFEREIHHLNLSQNPDRPFLFILGGAKFDTKLPLIEKFLKKADHCFVCGALSNDFFKAKGFEVGVSLVSDTPFDKEMINNPKLILPIDVVVKNQMGISTKLVGQLNKDDKIADSGPKTLGKMKELITEAKLIIWNGPLGYYEDGFDQPTIELARMIAGSPATSIIGGGDTIAAIETLGIADKFTFISTGGGAMLDFLLDDTLVGIEALKN